MKPPYRKDGPPRAGAGPRSRGEFSPRGPQSGPPAEGGYRPPRRFEGDAPRRESRDAGSAYVDRPAGSRPPRAVGPEGFTPRREAPGGERPYRPRAEGDRGGGFRPRAEGDRGPGGFRPRAEGDRGPGGFRPRAEGDRGPGGFRPRAEGDRGPGGFRPRPEGDRGERSFRPRPEGDRGPGGFRPRAEGDRGPGGFRPRAEGDRGPGGFRPRPEGDRGERSFRPRPEGDRGPGGFRPRPEGDRGERSFRPRAEGDRGPGGFRPRPEGDRGERSFRPRPEADRGERSLAPSGEAGPAFKPRRGFGEERTTLRARRSDDLTPRTGSTRPSFGDRQFEPPYRAPARAQTAEIIEAPQAAAAEPEFDPAMQRRMELRVHGLNAVLALFRNRPAAIRKLWFTAARSDALAELIGHCARNQIGFNEVDAEELQRITGSEHHEGVCVAVLRMGEPDRAELLDELASASGNLCVLLLDQVGNPHNLGAILRSAAHFGVSAILLTPGSNALLSGASYRVAEGGAEAQPIVALESLDELETLTVAGFVLAGTVVSGGQSLLSAQTLPPRLILALGAEGPGLSPELAERADINFSIPGSGAVESLNVAAATAVALAIWRSAHP